MKKEYLFCASCHWEGDEPDTAGTSLTDGMPSCPECNSMLLAPCQRPLFIALCAGPYDEFAAGTKLNMEEYRPEGPRWNAEVCRIGRRVVLSLGYGKKHRLQGVIVGYRTTTPDQVPNWQKYYPKKKGPVAAIKIEVER